jgi:hypothetical protein
MLWFKEQLFVLISQVHAALPGLAIHNALTPKVKKFTHVDRIKRFRRLLVNYPYIIANYVYGRLARQDR